MIWSLLLLLFFVLFFDMSTQEGGGGIRISDLRFMRRGLSQLSYLLETGVCYY
jgi:hypothetical protein